MKKWEHPYTPDPQYGKRVAYLSMEFGIDQSFKIYSGGLGYLAGSHMRSAYQLKQNMVGVGMLWRYGYYDQVRKENGTMNVLLRRKFYSFLQDTGIKVTVYVKGYQVVVKALYLAPEIFNTVPMYFLTTDIMENDHLARSITSRLYDPNDATRVAQNIVLGIGGAKVIEAIGGTDLFHINEAHPLPVAFHLLSKYGNVEEVRKRLVFTTHTPEKAGNSVRSIYLLDEMGFFNGIPLDTARDITGMYGDMFEYTAAALRMSRLANGVSEIHGRVARKMWEGFPGICDIISITNAQDEVYWKDAELNNALEAEDDERLKSRKREMKRELFLEVADQEGDLVREDVLTIVWARRFAGYKRSDLILRDLDRFLKIVNNEKYPVQVIWAGKPHPDDHAGISHFDHVHRITYRRPNISILTGYELALSAKLKKGADIWLNTPRRPQEASGTSGMTAAMNGAVNVSTHDGWIPEFIENGYNGYSLPPADLNQDIISQDDHDHEHLMDLLENTLIPMYYEQPDEWLRIVKNSMRDVCPRFDSKRMAHEYYQKLYQ